MTIPVCEPGNEAPRVPPASKSTVLRDSYARILQLERMRAHLTFECVRLHAENTRLRRRLDQRTARTWRIALACSCATAIVVLLIEAAT